MTFDEAMDVARNDGKVTRPSWHILRTIMPGSGEESFNDMILDNTEGSMGGYGGPYKPTGEDRAAADWMRYQPRKITGSSWISPRTNGFL